MQMSEFDGIDDYENFLTDTMSAWTPAQCAAAAAAMAERWLHVYEAFSKAEEWGDPAMLRRGIDAAWARAKGRALSAGERDRLQRQVQECTPHADDFDAPEALAAAVIVRYAIDCCDTAVDPGAAVWAVLSCFEVVSPDCLTNPDENPRFWKKAAVRKELERQRAALEEIAATTRFDGATVAALRKRLVSRALAGVLAPAHRPSRPSGPSNQTLFEQNRGMVEPGLRHPGYSPPADAAPHLVAVHATTMWSTRYSTRRNLFGGSMGRPADAIACDLVVERNRARDAADREPAAWDAETRWSIDRMYAIPYSGPEVNAPEAAHAFGPSMRRLWLDAKRAGASDADAWRAVAAWASHVPPSWAEEDARRKRGLSYTAKAVAEAASREIDWSATGDLDRPWTAVVDGATWTIGLNDFPDEPMYALWIGEEAAGSFHDWPERWTR